VPPERILPDFLVLSIHICSLRLRSLLWTLLFDNEDLSTVFGTEALAGREMVPDNAPNSRNSMPIELVGGRRFLKVANLRAGSKASKIWEHGFESRSIISSMISIGAASTVSNAKKPIALERNILADTTVKVTEYLKAWWDCSDPSRLGTAVTSRAVG
jgi:hypothetical protein